MTLDEPMPKTRLPFMLHERNRHGNFSWVFRRDKKAKRIKINGDYGSEQFMAEYAGALAGGATVRKNLIVQKGSLRWLVLEWKKSSDWLTTKPSTRRQRENILLHILEKNGHFPFSQVDDQAIIEGRESRATTPAAANNYLKAMRALFSWAHDVKLLKVNPAKDVKFIANRTDGHEPWTIEDVEAYRTQWPIGGRQRLAFEIYYWTGLRRGDATRMGRQHIGRDGIARIRMEKTEQLVAFEMPSQLLDVISNSPVGDLTFIATVHGKPYKKESLGNEFREWCRKAGIRKSAHGIRKFAAADAAMNGASESELNAMFGWQTNNQSLVYTRSASKAKQATEAIAKRGGNVNSAAPLLPPANLKKGV